MTLGLAGTVHANRSALAMCAAMFIYPDLRYLVAVTNWEVFAVSASLLYSLQNQAYGELVASPRGFEPLYHRERVMS